MPAAPFSPYEQLAARLLPYSRSAIGDASHDFSHLLRVWKNITSICAEEGGDGEILLAATLLHDCVAIEKNSPLRTHASRLAADKATSVLNELGWSKTRIDAVAHAIEAHSFSSGVEPKTLEAFILRDADRLDAIGAVGIARCFYVAGRMSSALYDPGDPSAEMRHLNDSRYALDHFHAKLFGLTEGFHTRQAQKLSQERRARLKRFYDAFMDEITIDDADDVGLASPTPLARSRQAAG